MFTLHRIKFNLFNSKLFKSAAYISNIPTPKSLPMLGHSYLFFPKYLGGTYSIEKLTEAIEDISKKLGPLFKLNLGGVNMLITIDTEHTKCMYRNEGKYPARPTFDALIKYRKEQYGTVGIVPGNGEEWHKFRSGINPVLKMSMVKQYERKITDVSKSFIDYIDAKTSHNYVCRNIYEDLLLFAIQAISVVSPGTEFKCLSSEQSSDAKNIIQASVDFMEGLHSTLMGLPLWKLYKNAAYRKLETSHNKINEIISKDLKKHYENFMLDGNAFESDQPFLYSLFNNKRLTYEDCVMLNMEIFLGGIDAVATTLSYTLSYLAENKLVQSKARSDLSNEYLKSCIKETLRLKTTAGANSRFLMCDVDIDGHCIPKGTLIMSFVSAMGKSEKYFDEPLKYKPERWFRSSPVKILPFASLPFGYGARMCPGRRLAESEMLILLRMILENYELSLPDSIISTNSIGMVYRLNRIPEEIININIRRL